MTFKFLIPPLILSALVLCGCVSTSANENADKKSNAELLSELSYAWFEKQSGLTTDQLAATPNSEWAKNDIHVIDTSYPVKVENRIKESLRHLYSNIPDVNFTSRLQQAPEGACVSAEKLRVSVKKSLPFLLTRNLVTTSQRELMREMINTMGRGYKKASDVSSNVFTLTEVQREFYYRAAIKLAYIMHHPQFASDPNAKSGISCRDLENLFVPMILAKKLADDNSSSSALLNLQESALRIFINVVAYLEKDGNLHLIIAARNLPTPVFKAQSGRNYIMNCKRLDNSNYTYKRQFEARGDSYLDTYNYAERHFDLERVKANELFSRMGVQSAYSKVNGYQYVGSNNPTLFDHWIAPAGAYKFQVDVRRCSVPKSLLSG